MNDTIVSFIRTWVPILVGSLITWLTDVIGLTDVDTTGLAISLTGLVIGLYYALARLAEQKWPWVGVLLGKRTQPAYSNVIDLKSSEYSVDPPDVGDGYTPPVH